MSNQLTHLQIKNFRSLADVNIQINPLNIIFGPNGAEKLHYSIPSGLCETVPSGVLI